MSHGSKVVVITGGSSGIGAATAKMFAKHGAMLTITGRNEEKLSKVSQECRELGAEEVLEVIADQKNLKDLEKIIRKTTENFGKLNVLVNNAGFVMEKFGVALENAPVEWFDEIFHVNVRAHFYLTQLAIPYLEQTNGSVVNVTGLSGSTVGSRYPIYAMAKSSLEQFSKLAALNLASKGIRVNTVAPASVKTNIFVSHGVLNEKAFLEYYENAARLHPLGSQIVEADEVASSILFLSSDEASAITGTCLYVDRGQKLTKS